MAAFCIAGALRLTEVTRGSLRKVATERIVATKVCSLQCYLIETSLHSTRPLHLQCMYGRATVYEYVVRRDFHFALADLDLSLASLVPCVDRCGFTSLLALPRFEPLTQASEL